MNTWKQVDFDAIVVGSGPGGATIAKELNQQGKKVLVLERGSGAPIAGNFFQTISMSLIPGKGLFFTPQLLALIRGIIYGGSSIQAYACAFDPPYEMFDAYGIDLRTEVNEAKKELPIAPLADHLIGPAARRIMDSAQDLGYDWQKLPKMVYQDNCRVDCDKCTMGCPFSAKWTARMYIEEAQKGQCVLVTDANVKQVIGNNHTAEAVVFSHMGEEYRVAAPTIILAAGGIGTPIILRNSGISKAGYDFFFDPLIVVMGTVDGSNYGREFPMATGQQFKEDGYIMTDLVWPNWIYWMFTLEIMRLNRLADHPRALPIMVKVKEGLGGRLTDRGGVRKRLDDSDKKKLQHGYERAKTILKHAGAKNIWKTWYMATHPGGTAKINDVVDSNLRTELDNLFICDCSVVPESWGLPPMLTIIALAKRLAKHLASEEISSAVSNSREQVV